MAKTPVTIKRADVADLEFVMATERMPGFDQFIGCWNERQHRAAFASPSSAYLLGLQDSLEAEGFALILDIDDSHGNIFLKRIAVRKPGHGFGTKFLRSIVDWVFAQSDAYRFWLDVLDSNARARHVYRKVGFVEEGVMRKAWRFPDGARGDLRLMSLTRPEWS